MQDRPTAPELLDALSELLFAEVREWVPRERRFQVLVAANVCAVIARELRAGLEPTLADIELFEGLAPGYEPPPGDPVPEDGARESAATLARGIRAGELDGELGAVIEGLRAHVRRKLDVARPGYAG